MFVGCSICCNFSASVWICYVLVMVKVGVANP
jgi:hypothetical protein